MLELSTRADEDPEVRGALVAVCVHDGAMLDEVEDDALRVVVDLSQPFDIEGASICLAEWAVGVPEDAVDLFWGGLTQGALDALEPQLR